MMLRDFDKVRERSAVTVSGRSAALALAGCGLVVAMAFYAGRDAGRREMAQRRLEEQARQRLDAAIGVDAVGILAPNLDMAARREPVLPARAVRFGRAGGAEDESLAPTLGELALRGVGPSVGAGFAVAGDSARAVARADDVQPESEDPPEDAAPRWGAGATDSAQATADSAATEPAQAATTRRAVTPATVWSDAALRSEPARPAAQESSEASADDAPCPAGVVSWPVAPDGRPLVCDPAHVGGTSEELDLRARSQAELDAAGYNFMAVTPEERAARARAEAAELARQAEAAALKAEAIAREQAEKAAAEVKARAEAEAAALAKAQEEARAQAAKAAAEAKLQAAKAAAEAKLQAAKAAAEAKILAAKAAAEAKIQAAKAAAEAKIQAAKAAAEAKLLAAKAAAEAKLLAAKAAAEAKLLAAKADDDGKLQAAQAATEASAGSRASAEGAAAGLVGPATKAPDEAGAAAGLQPRGATLTPSSRQRRAVGAIQRAPAPARRFFVQVKSLRNEVEAAAVADSLRAKGLGPSVMRADLGEVGVFFRVRLGPFHSQEAATAARDGLHAGGDVDAIVVTQRPESAAP